MSSPPPLPPSPPATYATAEQARAYIAALAARPPLQAPGRVYLIHAPSLNKSAAWPKLLPAVTAKLPGAELLGFADVFGKPGTLVSLEDRIPRILAAADGALVIPRQVKADPPRWLLGYAAAQEARALVAAGRPVLVLTRNGLAAWPDVRARPADEPHSRWLQMELDLPWQPDRPLPTLAASCRALGIPAPTPRPPRATRPAPDVPAVAAPGGDAGH